MYGFIGLIASVVLAGVVGFLAERIRVRPVVQSVGAVLVGSALACLLQSTLLIASISRSGHLVTVSFALTPTLGGAVLVAVIFAAGGHWFLGWVGSFIRVPIA